MSQVQSCVVEGVKMGSAGTLSFDDNDSPVLPGDSDNRLQTSVGSTNGEVFKTCLHGDIDYQPAICKLMRLCDGETHERISLGSFTNSLNENVFSKSKTQMGAGVI